MGLKLPEKSSAGAPGDRRPGLERPRAQPHSCPERPVLLADEARPGTNTGCDRRPQEVRDPLPLCPLLQSMQSTVSEQTLAQCAWGALRCLTPSQVRCSPATQHAPSPGLHQSPWLHPSGLPAPEEPPADPTLSGLPLPPGPHPRCLSERLSRTLTQSAGPHCCPGAPMPPGSDAP